MHDKPIHFVGGIPGADAEAVFRSCGPVLGDRIAALPDGETGRRRSWIAFLAQGALDQHPHLNAVSRPKPVGSVENDVRGPGDDWVPSGWDDYWSFSVEPGVTAIEFESLGYAEHALASYATFSKLQDEGVIASGVRFQVCLPLAESALRWFVQQRRDYEIIEPGYNAALQREIQTIVDAIPHDRLCIQWDVCMEVIAAELDDYTGEVPLAWRLEDTPIERWQTALAKMSPHIPEAVTVGLHLCYGDLGHKHMVEPKDLTRSVEMANIGVNNAGRRIDFVHMAVPRERSDDAYFAPLKDLNIGDAMPFLGLVHHTDGEAGTRARIQAAKKVIDRFGVATECGLSRRPPGQQLDRLLEIHCDAVEAL